MKVPEELTAGEANTPGLIRQGVNFTQAVARHLTDGLRVVSEEIVAERLVICKACEYCDVERMICRRRECGCLLKLKAKWRSENCPLGKWPDAMTAAESEN